MWNKSGIVVIPNPPRAVRLSLHPTKLCIVSCFELYLSLVPKDGPFYRTPIGESSLPYSVQPVAINTLKNIGKNLCAQAGFQGQYSNHSGKVTCATELFRNNVDEQLIMKQTGHRSQDAVRTYKRPSTEHTKAVLQYLTLKRKLSQHLAYRYNSKVTNLSSHVQNPQHHPSKIDSSGNSVQNIYTYSQQLGLPNASYFVSALYYTVILMIMIINIYS